MSGALFKYVKRLHKTLYALLVRNHPLGTVTIHSKGVKFVKTCHSGQGCWTYRLTEISQQLQQF